MFSFRHLLLPFSWLYATVVLLRNKLFDWGIKSSYEIPGASICIGNITVGGTGKSPLTKWLTSFLNEFNPVILSRGYGRKTTGLLEADSTASVSTIGDEPYMYWSAFEHKVPVVVAEKRKLGVDYIREKYPLSPILLDDAFQHRAVKSGLSIVCMTYDRPVFEDFIFPAGNLRETRCGMKRADIALVTKCPEEMTPEQKLRFYKKIPLSNRLVFFSHIAYGQKTGLFGEKWTHGERIVVVTGIAQPEPLYRFLRENHEILPIRFSDHHDFNASDIQQIQQKVATFGGERVPVVITEKDAAKFREFEHEIKAAKLEVFVQAMTVQIDREDDFKDLIRNYVIRTNERSC